MKSLLVLICMTGIIPLAQGQIVDYITTCNSMNYSFNSDREECYEVLRDANYFDEGALEVCKTASFDDDRTDCVRASLNKVYLASEISRCKAESFGDDKAECMLNSGRPYIDRNPDQETKRLVRRAKRQIRNGRYNKAINTLDRLLDRLN